MDGSGVAGSAIKVEELSLERLVAALAGNLSFGLGKVDSSAWQHDPIAAVKQLLQVSSLCYIPLVLAVLPCPLLGPLSRVFCCVKTPDTDDLKDLNDSRSSSYAYTDD
jgi:hypothetical protein